MERICGKCEQGIKSGERAMVCEGFCENLNRFHLTCVGCTIEDADLCQHRNIMWMCDCCRDRMEDSKFRNTVNELICNAEPLKVHDSELELLKQDIRRMQACLVELSEIVKDGKSSRELNVVNSTNIVPRNVLSSTTIHHEELPNPIANDVSYFDLFLSNIAPDVTEEDVDALVRATLDIFEPIDVKRLVPAWKNATSLDYVSFKVKLKQKHRMNALDATIWPTGIRCREFRSYSTRAWRPSR